MEFVSKYNMTFINSVNKKYNKKFKSFEEYSLYLYDLKQYNADYYYQLEEDLKDYCNYQQERKYNYGKQKRKNTQ